MMKVLLVVLSCVSTLLAQCDTPWAAASGLPGLEGSAVNAMAWYDPDGAGPRVPQAIFAGLMTAAGSVEVNNIAAWDPATGTWSALGSGLDSEVRALQTLPNGDLVAGGSFTLGGVPAFGVARWDGVAWSAMGSGLQDVYSFALRPNGDLLAGGVGPIMRWDGSSWSTFAGVPALPLSGPFAPMVVTPNGNLLVGTNTPRFSVSEPAYLHLWDGTSWSSLGRFTTLNIDNPRISALLAMPSGDVVACGNFSFIDDNHFGSIVRWDGAAWSTLGYIAGGTREIMAQLPNGNLVVATDGSVGGGNTRVAVFDGVSWSRLGSTAINQAALFGSLLVDPLGNILIGGRGASTIAGGYRWDGTEWSYLTRGSEQFAMKNMAKSIAAMSNGRQLVGGSFNFFNSPNPRDLAQWDGVAWSPAGLPWEVQTMRTLTDGAVVAAYGSRLARYDGVAWSPIAANFNYPVLALAELPDGNLVVGGDFTQNGSVLINRIATWNGTVWAGLGSGLPGTVRAIVVMANGDLVVSHADGGYASAAHRLSRWNGTSWSTLGSGTDGNVAVLEVTPAGTLVAGGSFATIDGVPASRIAAWDGQVWSAMGSGINGTVASLEVLPDGDVVAAGAFTLAGGTAVNNIARWDGSTWSPFGTGTNGAIVDTAIDAHGDLHVVGNFRRAGGLVTGGLARLTTTCPATAVPYGAACAGGAGPLELAASSLPWLGSTLRLRGTGLGASSFGISMIGTMATAVPLSQVHPAGDPACFQLANSDVQLDFVPVDGGVVRPSIAVPRVVDLVGFTVRAQVAEVVVTPGFDIAGIHASNGLSLQLGVF